MANRIGKKLPVSVGKSMIMKYTREKMGGRIEVELKSEVLKGVKNLKYSKLIVLSWLVEESNQLQLII